MIRIGRNLAFFFLLAGALLPARMVSAQDGAPQLLDSLEEYQQRVEGLIRERLKAVVPSGNFVLRIFVLGKLIQVPRSVKDLGTAELPGFQRKTEGAPATVEKFEVESLRVSILVNENLASAEQEYIESIVPLLADFRPERGDALELRVVPPTPAEAAEEEGLSLRMEPRDWILVGVLALIVLLLLIVMFRVLIGPRARPAPQPFAPPDAAVGAPAPAATLGAGGGPGASAKADQDALVTIERQKQLDGLRDGVVRVLFSRAELGSDLVQAWQDQPDKVGGLIHALGPTIARQALLPHLDRERYKDLEQTVRQEETPSTEALIDLMREANLFLVAQDLAHPEEVRPDPFGFLEKLSRGQVAHLIKEEPVRIKAIVLSRIDPSDTALILDTLPKDLQVEVAVQIGNFQSMPLEMADEVARDLAVKARDLPDARTMDIEGTKKLVDLMGRTSFNTSRYLLEAIKARDTQLSEAVEKRFFIFEAIPMVPDDVLPQVVRTLPSTTVVQALQGADQEIQRKVIMAFPEQARPGLVTTLRASQYDEESVMEARRQVINGFQSLAEQGKIDLKQISDAYQAKAS